MDIAFQLPDFFLQGIDFLVDGFQFDGILSISIVFTHLRTKTTRFLQTSPLNLVGYEQWWNAAPWTIPSGR